MSRCTVAAGGLEPCNGLPEVRVAGGPVVDQGSVTDAEATGVSRSRLAIARPGRRDRRGPDGVPAHIGDEGLDPINGPTWGLLAGAPLLFGRAQRGRSPGRPGACSSKAPSGSGPLSIIEFGHQVSFFAAVSQPALEACSTPRQVGSGARAAFLQQCLHGTLSPAGLGYSPLPAPAISTGGGCSPSMERNTMTGSLASGSGSTSTMMVSPARNSFQRIFSERGSSTRRCKARRSGRAPMVGS